MCKKWCITNNFICLILFANLLANATAWTFDGEVFTHELDHHHATYEFDHYHHSHQHLPSLAQTEEIEHRQHSDATDDQILDFIIHLSLHAAGQNQPFYFIFPPILPSVEGKEIISIIFPTTILESTFDSPFRPPRNTSALS